ncbi:MAG: ribokinase [Alphaproteobacteria bacterium]|jgi:ribokinase|nr:ribokinase [Alphaproteobacteria bacterium]MDP6817230.1 ribokinase [Alphaproteobacteria bacterium]
MSAVVILGVFVADTAYRATRQPRLGETILGSGFALGPGGKGSNQSVAAARLGADVTFISKIGVDPFGDMAMRIWAEAGVKTEVERVPESYTGAASIFLEDGSGDNAIIVCPGAAATISTADIEALDGLIGAASVFVTQLEQPLPAARRALEIARQAGVTTILNPAPAAELGDEFFTLSDYFTPNETEAEDLTGIKVGTVEEARQAGEALLDKGVGNVIITLGEQGALLHTREISELCPAHSFAPVAETTGAGDAFNGAFAVALARGDRPLEAVRFGCAVAGISVTRPGTAQSMPTLKEVEEALGA